MAKDIDNPCVSLCQLNSELCVSCGRTRDEIRKWRGMKRPEKMATVQRAATRMKAIVKKMPSARPGRSRRTEGEAGRLEPVMGGHANITQLQCLQMGRVQALRAVVDQQ